MQTWKKIILILILIVLVGMGYVVYSFSSLFFIGEGRETSEKRTEDVNITADPVTFLLIGTDNNIDGSRVESEGYRADTLIFGAFDINTMRTQMITIPRDSLTTIPCENNKKDKINHSLQYGYIENNDLNDGIECTVKSVEGLMDMPVDYYALTSFDGFISIIDVMGGIDIEASATFCEQDSSSKLDTYCFKEGQTYNMDGEEALAYSRHRHSDSAVARGSRQQEVIGATISKLITPEVWVNTKQIVDTVSKNIMTNVSTAEMMQLVTIAAPKISNGNAYSVVMNTDTLDAEGEMIKGTYYGILDAKNIKEMAQKVKLILDGKYDDKETTTNFVFLNPEEQNAKNN